MVNLTKESFEKTLKEALGDQSKDLKSFMKAEIDELARMVAEGFHDTNKRLDVVLRVERVEKIVQQLAQAINLKVT